MTSRLPVKVLRRAISQRFCLTQAFFSRSVSGSAGGKCILTDLGHAGRLANVSHNGACWHRLYSTSEVLPEPPATETEREYAPNIQKLVNDIGELTLMEVADLNELLKKTLKISDAPMMAMGPSAPAAAQEEEDEAQTKQAKAAFTVKLTKFDASKKVALIKEVKSLVEGMNLVQSKKLVESLPQSIRTDIAKEEAEKLKEALEKAGGTVELA